jgi:hypothetical protein
VQKYILFSFFAKKGRKSEKKTTFAFGKLKIPNKIKDLLSDSRDTPVFV